MLLRITTAVVGVAAAFSTAPHIWNEHVFELPEEMLGLWINGIPTYSILGPRIGNFSFGVTRAENGDYLLQDQLVLDGVDMGWQRFYVEGVSKNPGLLWYCGYLLKDVWARYAEATGPTANTTLSFVFKALDQSATHVSWCLDSDNVATAVGQPFSPFPSNCEFCECGNWTLSLEEDRADGTLRLRSQLLFPGAEGHSHSKHLDILFDRAEGPPPVINESDWPQHGDAFRCDWDGRDGVPVDVFNATSAAVSTSGCPHITAILRRATNQDTDATRYSTEDTSTVADEGSEGGEGEENLPASLSSRNYEKQDLGDMATAKLRHCYILNEHTDYRLAWTVRGSVVDIEVSSNAFSVESNTVSGQAELNRTWVGIGFRPQGRGSSDGIAAAPFDTGTPYKFGMKGADIVAGFAGSGNVLTYYASLYTG